MCRDRPPGTDFKSLESFISKFILIKQTTIEEGVCIPAGCSNSQFEGSVPGGGGGSDGPALPPTPSRTL